MTGREPIREALGAYRSALRSGERESEQMRKVWDAALAALSAREEALAAAQAENERLRAVEQAAWGLVDQNSPEFRGTKFDRLSLALHQALASRPGEGAA